MKRILLLFRIWKEAVYLYKRHIIIKRRKMCICSAREVLIFLGHSSFFLWCWLLKRALVATRGDASPFFFCPSSQLLWECLMNLLEREMRWTFQCFYLEQLCIESSRASLRSRCECARKYLKISSSIFVFFLKIEKLFLFFVFDKFFTHKNAKQQKGLGCFNSLSLSRMRVKCCARVNWIMWLKIRREALSLACVRATRCRSDKSTRLSLTHSLRRGSVTTGFGNWVFKKKKKPLFTKKKNSCCCYFFFLFK